VHLSLPYVEENRLNEVLYLMGSSIILCWMKKKQNETFTPNNGLLEATLKMKQGFYNYKYVIKKEKW